MATNGQAVLEAHNNWKATYKPVVPAPTDSTTQYADGWQYGDWWVANGRSRSDTTETPDGWSDERANGFWDRLAFKPAVN